MIMIRLVYDLFGVAINGMLSGSAGVAVGCVAIFKCNFLYCKRIGKGSFLAPANISKSNIRIAVT